MVTLILAASLGVTPAERTRALLDAFGAVHAPSEGAAPAPADREANAKAFAALDAFFDYEAITERALGPHKAKLTAAQLTKYKDTFKELIRRVAYPDSGRFIGRAQTTVGAANKNDVPVKFVIPAEDLEVNVTFHWADRGGTLKLVDASFDGASLVKDYQNQFGRIIDKEGVAGLQAKLDKRLDKERKASVL